MSIQLRNFFVKNSIKLVIASLSFYAIALCIFGLSAIGVIEGERKVFFRRIGDVSAEVGLLTGAGGLAGAFLGKRKKEAPKSGSDEGYSDSPF